MISKNVRVWDDELEDWQYLDIFANIERYKNKKIYQSTGLRDRNNREIFEGMRLRFSKFLEGIVRWNGFYFIVEMSYREVFEFVKLENVWYDSYIIGE